MSVTYVLFVFMLVSFEFVIHAAHIYEIFVLWIISTISSTSDDFAIIYIELKINVILSLKTSSQKSNVSFFHDILFVTNFKLLILNISNFSIVDFSKSFDISSLTFLLFSIWDSMSVIANSFSINQFMLFEKFIFDISNVLSVWMLIRWIIIMLIKSCYCEQNELLWKNFKIVFYQRCKIDALNIQKNFVKNRKSNFFVCHHLHHDLISRCLFIQCRALIRISAILEHQQITSSWYQNTVFINSWISNKLDLILMNLHYSSVC